jgi:hypothetical protein
MIFTHLAGELRKMERRSNEDPAKFWPLDCQNLSGVVVSDDVVPADG